VSDQMAGEAEYVRQLEDATLMLWAELSIAETASLCAEMPRLAEFMAHLHHSIEHEQAMVRQNVWADTPCRNCDNGSVWNPEAMGQVSACSVCNGSGWVPASAETPAQDGVA
jgi:hypothetical protein